MRENCKAVVARPTTVPIMSQSYVELHGLPNPSPCTVHKPHCGPYPNPTLFSSLSFSYDVALSAAYYYHYVFCDIWVPMLFDWHGLCVFVSVCVFELTCVLGPGWLEGSSGATSGLPPVSIVVSQSVSLPKHYSSTECEERDKWHVRYYSRAVKVTAMFPLKSRKVPQ